MSTPKKQQRKQRGGFFLGLIVGLLVGLSLALGVALVINKMPIPFVNKVPQRTAEQDANEAQRNKNWDPNSGLYGRNPAKPNNSASGTVAAPADAPSAASAPAGRNPADILADKALPPNTAASLPGGLSPSRSGDTSMMSFFVQAGAFSSAEDAEQQRGRLAMMGLQAKVSEREQAGRTVYRVRLGPYEKREDAGHTKERLDSAGVDATLVQVQK